MPREQLLHLVDRVAGDFVEHMRQVRLWVQPVKLRGADQAIQRPTAQAPPLSEPANR